MKLNWEKMVREIDAVVSTDFCMELEIKMLGKKPYTQTEAKKMVKILNKVYAIAHCCDCPPCGRKYDRSS